MEVELVKLLRSNVNKLLPSLKKCNCTTLLVFLAGLFMFTAFANALDNDEKLKEVQKQIEEKRQELQRRIEQKSDVEAEFQATELKVAQMSLALRQVNNELDSVKQKIRQLEKKQIELEQERKQHQGVLAETIKTAYLNGEHDYTKLLLNQNSPATLERLITYYRKLNDSRVKQIERVLQIANELSQVEDDLIAQQSTLVLKQQQQATDKKELEKAQRERKLALKTLNNRITSDKDRLNRLTEDEKRLRDAIELAQRNQSQKPSELIGLYNLKKQLSWPTEGKISKKFGQHRSNNLRWKGVTIIGELGDRVNSIADGIVLYSDWLKGFGWVAVVDHGKGYMSLYGHNQAILKQVGDYVEQGEPIALVGQSGGRSEPGLYFEIRYKGKTVNPARWCR